MIKKISLIALASFIALSSVNCKDKEAKTELEKQANKTAVKRS